MIERRGQGADCCRGGDPGAVIVDVARRHDITPQHLSNWIRAAKDGRFALPAEEVSAFVPVISVTLAETNKAAQERRPGCIEIVIGAVQVRVPGGANTRDVEAILRAVRRASA